MIIQFIGAVAGAAVIVGIISMVLARRIAKPLEALDEAVTSITKGDLKRKVTLTGDIQEVDSFRKGRELPFERAIRVNGSLESEEVLFIHFRVGVMDP